jgi:hypothetical protein
MKHKVSLCALFLAASFGVHADTRVHTVRAIQSTFLSDDFNLSAGRVAIDGNFAIVISNYGGGRLAYLYQRGADRQWTARATLLAVQTTTPAQDDDVAMANGIAALRIGPVLHIYERSGDAYVEADTAGTPGSAPGLAISGRRILAARRGCNYDADVYEKSTGSGVWRINGRILGPVGPCNNHGAALDLDGDVALVRNSPTEIREYRRNGTALQWVQVGTITPPAGANFTLGAPTLRGNVAFVEEGRYFERVGSSWTFRGRVEPLDSATGTVPFAADYRGPLLLSQSGPSWYRADPSPYLYMRNSAGGFDHVAKLQAYGGGYVDVSGNLAVAQNQDFFSQITLSFFELPVPLVAPAAIANDFETHDVTGWQPQSGSQFALANTSTGTVYRQSSLVGKSTALLTDSDWANAQSIEADIKPTAVDGSDRWVGLAVRYVDVNNQYYVTLRGSNKVFLQRLVAGSFRTLAEASLPFVLNRTYNVKLIVNGTTLEVYINGSQVAFVSDNALTHGRAALMTYKARADFDNVYVGSTDTFPLAFKDFGDPFDPTPEFTFQGGTWTRVEQDPSTNTSDVAFAQTDNTTDARAFTGVPTGDQVVEAKAHLDSYASPSAGWFGLLARWVNSHTYYYLAVRSNGRLDIRKKVNGTITVLRSVPFAATPGTYYRFKLAVTGNELHAYVNDVFVAGAIDDAIAKGRYGIGTTGAAATFQDFRVEQP